MLENVEDIAMGSEEYARRVIEVVTEHDRVDRGSHFAAAERIGMRSSERRCAHA